MIKIYLFIIFTSFVFFEKSYAEQSRPETTFLPLVTDISIKDKGSVPGLFPKYYRAIQNVASSDDPLNLGLQELAVAGTAQFTRKQLNAILEDLGRPVLVVDLRQETHFIMEDMQGNELPISAFLSQNLSNVDKTIEEIAWDHLLYKDYLLQEGVVRLHYTKNSEVLYAEDDPIYEIANIYTEKEAIEILNDHYSPGVHYLHMPFTDHHIPPVEVIDSFIELFRKFEEKQPWTMLFHCRAGRGRTGQLLVMSDMLANAKKYHLSCEQIIKRQAALGSPDFAAVDPLKVEQSLERHEFLEHFYQYAISDDGYTSGISYRSWLQWHPST